MIGYYPINPAGGDMQEDAFGPRFFRTRFFERMKAEAAVDGTTPILEIMLTSGQVLDISQILELKNDYILVDAFVDSRDDERTYKTYIRYITIYRINVLTRPREERAIGFTPHEPEESDEETPTGDAANELPDRA